MPKVAITVGLFAVCLFASSCGSSPPPSTSRSRSSQATPASYAPGGPSRGAGGASLFRLPMADGTPVTVKTPAALFFFTTWCGYCKQAMPEIKRLAERARQNGVRVYGIDVAENAGLVNGFIQQYQPNFPVLLDETQAVARRYGVSGYPTFIVIDENANIVYQGHEVPRNF